MIIKFRKSNKNLPVLQHVLKILLSTQYNSGRSCLHYGVLRQLLIFFEAHVFFLALQEFILAAGPHSFENGTAVVFRGLNCSNLVVLRAKVCRSSDPVAFSLCCDVTEGQKCIHKQQTR